MQQRPQQMCKALARKGHKVIFIDQTTPNCVEIEKNLWLYPHTGRIDDSETIIAYISSPILKPSLDYLQHNKNIIGFVYDVIDEIEVFGVHSNTVQNHEWLIENATIIQATSKNLYESIREKRKDVYLNPNGVFAEDFNLKEFIIPSDLEKIKEGNKTVVLYYGCIAEWLDYELIDYVAKTLPEVQFVFIGFEYNRCSRKFKQPNIHYLGIKDYRELPNYLAYSNVCMIPFIKNKVTDSVSPVKFYEYLAMGKPIVSTNIDEMIAERLKTFSVAVANTKEEFVTFLEFAIKLSFDDLLGISESAEKFIKNNTWYDRATLLLKHINRVQKPVEVKESKVKVKDKYTIVYPPTIDWDWMQQRPQRLMYALAQLEHKVYFCQNFKKRPGQKPYEIFPNLWLVPDPNLIQDEIDVLWIGNPGIQNEWIGKMHEKFVIYDCVDDFYKHWGGNEDLLTKKADVIVTTCKLLYDRKKKQKGDEDVHLIPNGFADSFYDVSNPPELDDMKQFEGKKVIGYAGALANWFDYDLLFNLAGLFKNFEFVLIGAEFHDMPLGIKNGEYKNIHWLGLKSHDKLKYYIDRFDVCIIPFKRNEITEATDPVKLYEYLAVGKPVVAKDLRTIREVFIGNAYLADGYEEFAEKIQKALIKTSEEDIKERREFVKPFTWVERAKEAIRIIDRYLK